jgi:hypothetical protein
MRDNSTTIHLVGEAIDAKRAQADELVQLERDLCVDADGGTVAFRSASPSFPGNARGVEHAAFLHWR